MMDTPYRVDYKHVRAGEPGERYVVTNPDSRVSYFRTIEFYRSPRGREVATDGLGNRLTGDGDLFRQVKTAVQKYDQKQAVADQFMQGRVDEYSRSGFEGSLLEYLGMTKVEYSEWFQTGVVPDRVKRVWRLS